jgi:spermidine synthase
VPKILRKGLLRGTKIIIVTDDAYRYIKNSTKQFDVIILLLPPPSTLSLNRYYTTDFFKTIKSCLNSDGLFLISPGQSSIYYNKESLDYYSSIFNSLKSNFKVVEPIMGNKLYFISSDNQISTSICSLVEQKGINTIYVNRNYLSDDLIKMKSEELLSLIDTKAKQNSLMKPVSYFQYMTINLSKERNNRPAIVALMSLVFVIPVTLIRRKNMIMYFSASALAGFEIITLMLIQLTIGNLYHITGLIIASVMAGLATGAGFGNKNISVKKSNLIAILLILFYVFTGIIFSKLILINGTIPVIMVAIILSFSPAFLTGRLFRSLSDNLTNYIDTDKIYSADLAGSAFGFITVSILFLSVLGIQLTIFMFSAFIFAGYILSAFDNKK